MYGLYVCTDDNRSLKLVAYRLVHTDESYTKLHFYANLTRVQILYAIVCQNFSKFEVSSVFLETNINILGAKVPVSFLL